MNKRTRREFLGAAAAAAAIGRFGLSSPAQEAGTPARPNVLLILTDDQGYGDLGCHGNDKIRTPNLDRLHAESVRLTEFHVCPVCTPTRASLMTGRYNFRTGAIDTYCGRAMMHPEEVTLAEMFASAGYRTGIFGKWHLGDCHPLRATDQGFQEALVHGGGGIGQPADPPGNGYFDPVLRHNGKAEKHTGYCTDIFTDAAMRFIEAARGGPWLAYLATNAPHDPLVVDEKYLARYRAAGLDDRTARVYAMCENLDENVGRLLRRLKELDLERTTIVVFMTDNGPAGLRYNAGLRGGKGSVYQGGLRAPCFIRWPGVTKAGTDIDRVAAHIDVVPTLLDACGVEKDPELRLDGISFMPLIRGEAVDWPERTLLFQWHRGDEPRLYRNCAARAQRYKMVCPEVRGGKAEAPSGPAFELYDLAADPGEKEDIASRHPEILARLRKQYEAWFKDVGQTRGYAPVRPHLGAKEENPVTLTRQDWRGAAGYGDKDLGGWEVHVAAAGKYVFRLEFEPVKAAAKLEFRLGAAAFNRDLEIGSADVTLGPAELPEGDARLDAAVTYGERKVGVHYVHVTRLEG